MFDSRLCYTHIQGNKWAKWIFLGPFSVFCHHSVKRGLLLTVCQSIGLMLIIKERMKENRQILSQCSKPISIALTMTKSSHFDFSQARNYPLLYRCLYTPFSQTCSTAINYLYYFKHVDDGCAVPIPTFVENLSVNEFSDIENQSGSSENELQHDYNEGKLHVVNFTYLFRGT